MEEEVDNKLSFLDILISKCDGGFKTGVFRKKTFTGLGQNFYSYCPLNFKFNSCRTLLHRAFNVCSSWELFHVEILYLTNYFRENCFPEYVFSSFTNKFLNNVFQPKSPSYDVPKKSVYISLPYLGSKSSGLKKELTSTLSKLYPYVKFHFIFKNPLTISSLFRFKDSLRELMRSSVVYLFTCPGCNTGTYIGCTNRLLKVRIDSHMGRSHRTGNTLNKKEESAVRAHCQGCRQTIQYQDFKIIGQANNKQALLFLESLYIKQLTPTLNNSTSSIPLQIA